MVKHDVAVVGVGQTKHASKRRDVNIPEMIYEAVKMALDDAQLMSKDIDAIIIGNMDHFEGINFSEMWTGIEAAPGYLKPVVKVATGGTTGSSLAICGYHNVASGIYNKILVVGWEKLQEGGATTGIITAFDPVWERPSLAGALGPLALMAGMYQHKYGITAEQAAKVTVKNRRNASNNPYAHLRMPDIKVEDVMTTSPKCIDEDHSAAEALGIMELFGITHLVILDREKTLKGVVHLHDLLGREEFRLNGSLTST